MPSPFPGMDPYLEGSLWPSVHAQLAVEIARQLTPRLVPRYIALTEKLFVLATPPEDEDVAIALPSLYPDAGVAETSFGKIKRDAGGVAIVAPLRMATLMPEPIPQISIEIRDTAERRLVTAIEVLSPTNKRGDGRGEYLEKRRKLLLSTAHLMEIDLLRTGDRVPMRKRLPAEPYFVVLSRANMRPVADVWPISLKEPLPEVPVPLLSGDADVPLNLQTALTAVYDGFGYSSAIDYARSPEIPLPPADSAWAVDQINSMQRQREHPSG